jgi:Leucine-rich repeat (LRR) protein
MYATVLHIWGLHAAVHHNSTGQHPFLYTPSALLPVLTWYVLLACAATGLTPSMARTAPRRQQQEELVLGVLFSANPSSTYAKDLLRPFHEYCSSGRAAALRTIRHLRLDRSEEPYPRQLWLLEAADQATALTIQTTQIPGLLAALLQQQEQQQKEEEEDEHQAQLASAAGGSTHPNTSSSRAAPWPQQPFVPVVSAIKPRGARITHLAVVGEPTLAITQQLEQLLDVLPATQHVEQIVLYSPDESLQSAKWTDWWVRTYSSQWVTNHIEAAVEDPHPYRFIISRATNSSTSSGSSGSRRVDNSTAGRGGMVPHRAAAGSWRSSCHTLVADLMSKRLVGDDQQQLSDLGPLLAALEQQQLQVLYINGADATDLPQFAATLRPLRALHMEYVQGADDPSVVGPPGDLPHLRHLGVLHALPAGLAHVPIAPGALPHLTSLDLSGAGWTRATIEQVCNISGLRKLDLSGTVFDEVELESLPECMSRLTGLEQLVMYRSDVVSLPDSMTALTRLRRLVWETSADGITADQLEVVWRLKSLQQLSLRCKDLVLLPAGIGQVAGLTKLRLDIQSLAELPCSLSMLAQLQQLHIMAQNAFLKPIAAAAQPLQLDAVCELRGLRKLHVRSDNMCLPANVGQLTGLSDFTVSGNCKGGLPDSLSMLVGLERLTLFLGNPLLAIPEGLTALTMLKAFTVPEKWLLKAPPSVQALWQAIRSQRGIF